MPTIKPRIAITLEQETYDVIARLAELQSRSKGAVVADLIDAVIPPLRRTVALLEAAQDAPDLVKSKLRSVVESAHQDLLKVSGNGQQQMEALLRGAASAESEGGSTPVPVTRGSGVQPEQPIRRLRIPVRRSGTED